jgi:hypothetical protein
LKGPALRPAGISGSVGAAGDAFIS